jgi:hypothetical protein
MNAYSIKIALRGVSPMIWRRLRVRGNTSMADLHHIIQIAMSWDNDHLHCFHIYGEDYGLKYDGGMDFNHNARQVFLGDFGFDVGDRFSYTYDITAYWLCDIRVKAIESISTATPRCFGGSGRQSEDGARYYKADEIFAMFDVLEKVVKAKKTTTVGELRPLIEHYEDVRFSRVLVNKQLKESFHS